MALKPAEKQRKYRQKMALERIGNGYTVTILKREMERTGAHHVYPELVELAEEIYEMGGRGDIFLERVSVLALTVLSCCPSAKKETAQLLQKG